MKKTSAPLKKNRGPSGDPILGARIRAARKGLEMTLEQLAEAVDKSPGAISQYETGHIDIAPETRVRLAIELGMPQEAFFKTPPGMSILSDDERLLLARWRKAPDALRQAILLILGSAPQDPNEPD